jgi:hypothetical protein
MQSESLFFRIRGRRDESIWIAGTITWLYSAVIMPNTPTEIIDGALWLGPTPVRNDGGVCYHTAQLRESGVTHVVNCTPDFPFPTAEQMGGAEVSQFRVPVEDVDGAPIEEYFDAASLFIHEAISAGGIVYVHCETGKSRSATICLAYRIRYCQEPLRAAYADTKSRRSYIQPKMAFVKKLVDFEVRISRAFEEDYPIIYLLDHYSEYMFVDGISEEAVRAAYADALSLAADASEAYSIADRRLMEIVHTAL